MTSESNKFESTVQKALDATDDSEMIDSASDNRTVNNVMRHEYRVFKPSRKASDERN